MPRPIFCSAGPLEKESTSTPPPTSPTPNASQRETATNAKMEKVSAEAEKKADLKMVKTGKLKVNGSL